ncbi:transcription factor Adf-1-like [Metopolophium dirhodum]|uniref:transcription factor Adf-1-like n=1 Tax=Metopolophium dirhodum TaxID=44670 RepID=UPI00298FB59C|nr:transcription factor Adf-1-like [Metopolophium dirhodum]
MACDGEILVSLIEKRPSIYDFKHKDHSNRTVQDKLWEEISKEMDVSVSVCKSKWTSLRNSYARELREIKNKKSGSAASKKRKWYLFESMSFLSDFMLQHKQMISNVSDTCNEHNERSESEEYSFDTSTVEDNISPEDGTASERELNETVFKRPKKSKTQLKTASEQVAEPMIEFLKSRTKQANTSEDSSEILFFKSLIPDYKKLNDKNQRRFKTIVQDGGQNMNNYYNVFASDVGSGTITDSSNSSSYD